jgi:hypothetical protein
MNVLNSVITVGQRFVEMLLELFQVLIGSVAGAFISISWG